MIKVITLQNSLTQISSKCQKQNTRAKCYIINFFEKISLKNFKERRLNRLEMVVSDGHKDLNEAAENDFTGAGKQKYLKSLWRRRRTKKLYLPKLWITLEVFKHR